MSDPPPPHYTAFRIGLVVVLVVALGVAAWWVSRPPVLAALYDFLGLG